MQMAGLHPHVDSLGNLIGRYEQVFETPPRRICIGSHLDSVRNAGKYDGVLGVLLGIAVTEAIKTLGITISGSIDIVGFSEEEGVRYSLPYLGSMAIAGKFGPSLLERLDGNGVSMRVALETFGLNADEYVNAKLPLNEYVAYLEAHIEQGPVLEALEQPLGVVDAIVGQTRLWMTVHGMAGHSGTLPMKLRRDALTAASDCVLAIEEYAYQSEGLVATVGGFHVSPNATNVIAGVVRFSIDVRHSIDEVRRSAVDEILSTIEKIANNRGVEIEIVDRSDFEAVPMNSALVKELAISCREALEELSDSTKAELLKGQRGSRDHPLEVELSQSDVYILSSGAGHDAAVLASVIPSVMLFIQSPGGISHHPLESVRSCDVSIAIDAIFRFVLKKIG